MNRARMTGSFRKIRAIKYMCFMIGATLTLFFPSGIITGVFADYIGFTYLWTALLGVGSLLCLGGILTRTWVGEYVGLWGVIFSTLLYALGCFTDVNGGSRVFLGFFVLGFMCSAIARYQDVLFQKRVADYESRLREGRPGL